MEKIYSESLKKGEFVKARPETIQFLLGFSKSLHIIECDGFQFENSLN